MHGNGTQAVQPHASRERGLTARLTQVCVTVPPQKCRRCEEQKPASEFYKNRLMLDGLYRCCSRSLPAF